METAAPEAAAVASSAPAPPVEASRLRRHREALLAAGGLAILLALSYAWYVTHGGLYSDDWSLIGEQTHSPLGGRWAGFEALWERASYRPVSVLYYGLLFPLLGPHGTIHLLWSVLVTAAFVGGLYAVLRATGVKAIHAFIVSALVLVAPMGDAAALWPSAAPVRFAGALYLLGLWLTVRALRDPDRYGGRSRHVAAILCYLAAMFTYELTVALTAAGLLVYLTVARPRAALKRWGVDMAVTVVAALWTRAQTPKTVGSVHEMYIHARIIVSQLFQMFDEVAFPFGGAWAVGGATMLIGVLGLAAVLRGGERFAEARRWTIVGLVALVYVMAAYVVFVPASTYYSPAAVNFGNRVNGVGVAPLVLLAYAALMVLVALIAQRNAARALVGVGVVYGAVMFFLHNGDLRDHQRMYVQAAANEQVALDTLEEVVPDPPKGTLLLTTGVPPFIAPDLPVFASTWDMQSAVRILYDDSSLDGFNAYAGFQCTPGQLTVNAGPAGPYGRTILVHVPTRQVFKFQSQAACRAIAAEMGVPQG